MDQERMMEQTIKAMLEGTDIPFESVEIVRVEDGDILLIHTDRKWSDEAIARSMAYMEKQFPKQRILMLNDCDLKIIRMEERNVKSD